MITTKENEAAMQFGPMELLTVACMSVLPAVMLWGALSARMQATPWRMMAMALLVVGPVTVLQVIVTAEASHPGSDQVANLFFEKLKIYQLAWMSVALGMGGALFGAAVAARAAQLHATEIRRLERKTASNVENLRRAKKDIAVLRASALPHSPAVQEALDKAIGRLVLYADDEHSLRRERHRMGLDE
jgi:hypothetical protein